jgi:AraC-like DNA-binding protein
MSHGLALALDSSVRYHNGGRFVSRGQGRHFDRVGSDHELIIVTGGTLAMYEGDRQVDLRAGDFLHLSPGLRHGGIRDYDADTGFYWLHFEHRTPKSFAAVLPPSGRLVQPEPVIDATRRLLDAQDRSDTPPGVCNLLMLLVLFECTRVVANADEVDPSGLAERARSFIVLNHAEAIGAAEVASHCGCHPDHLGRCYRARFGRTLTEAIHDERLRRSRQLLRDSDHPIGSIALSCGYRDAHYFRRCFHRAAGMSPVAWRRLYQRQHVNTE